VLDMKDVGDLMNDALDAGLDMDSGAVSGLIVTCTIAARAAPVSCDDAAKTYVRAVGGTASAGFIVKVDRQNDSRTLCESSYDASGVLSPSSTTTGGI
jgi:hypothetical protein